CLFIIITFYYLDLHSYPTTTLFRSTCWCWLVRSKGVTGSSRKLWACDKSFVKFIVESCNTFCYTMDKKRKGAYLCLISSQSRIRSEEHTSELQSRFDLVCRLLLEKK